MKQSLHLLALAVMALSPALSAAQKIDAPVIGHVTLSQDNPGCTYSGKPGAVLVSGNDSHPGHWINVDGGNVLVAWIDLDAGLKPQALEKVRAQQWKKGRWIEKYKGNGIEVTLHLIRTSQDEKGGIELKGRMEVSRSGTTTTIPITGSCGC